MKPTPERYVTPAAGWYRDPWGRYEYRYFNGTGWTGDVSSSGHRTVDQLAVRAAAPSTPLNQTAIAALIVVGVAALVGLVPYLFLVAVPAVIVGAVLGVIGLRRARGHSPELRGSGRVTAIVALVAVPVALAACAVGVILTREVEREARRYRQLDTDVVTFERCDSVDNALVATARIDSPLDESATFTVAVRVTSASGARRDLEMRIQHVPARGSERFELDSLPTITGVRCSTIAVTAKV